MREPDTIMKQVDTWRPESLAAYERRRRAQRSTEHDRLMAEAARMMAEQDEAAKQAAKGGRPRKDGTLKGTGILTLNRSRTTTRALKPCGTEAAYQRGCRCEPCKEARRAYERSRKAVVAIPAAPIKHGRKAYALGCRCDVCREAETTYRRQWRIDHPEEARAQARDKARARRAREQSGQRAA